MTRKKFIQYRNLQLLEGGIITMKLKSNQSKQYRTESFIGLMKKEHKQ